MHFKISFIYKNRPKKISFFRNVCFFFFFFFVYSIAFLAFSFFSYFESFVILSLEIVLLLSFFIIFCCIKKDLKIRIPYVHHLKARGYKNFNKTNDTICNKENISYFHRISNEMKCCCSLEMIHLTMKTK